MWSSKNVFNKQGALLNAFDQDFTFPDEIYKDVNFDRLKIHIIQMLPDLLKMFNKSNPSEQTKEVTQFVM